MWRVVLDALWATDKTVRDALEGAGADPRAAVGGAAALGLATGVEVLAVAPTCCLYLLFTAYSLLLTPYLLPGVGRGARSRSGAVLMAGGAAVGAEEERVAPLRLRGARHAAPHR